MSLRLLSCTVGYYVTEIVYKHAHNMSRCTGLSVCQKKSSKMPELARRADDLIVAD